MAGPPYLAADAVGCCGAHETDNIPIQRVSDVHIVTNIYVYIYAYIFKFTCIYFKAICLRT